MPTSLYTKDNLVYLQGISLFEIKAWDIDIPCRSSLTHIFLQSILLSDDTYIFSAGCKFLAAYSDIQYILDWYNWIRLGLTRLLFHILKRVLIASCLQLSKKNGIRMNKRQERDWAFCLKDVCAFRKKKYMAIVHPSQLCQNANYEKVELKPADIS